MANIRKITSPISCLALALDSAPDDLLGAVQWDLNGDLLKPGSRSTVTRIDIAGTPYVFKQYKALALRRRIRYALTRSRAKQSWENGQRMADLGLPVVRPLAFFEESSLGIPARSLLIMPFQKGTPLNEYANLEQAEPALRETFQAMAQHQITHGDLKATNILIDDRAQPHFIDIDPSHIHQSKASYLKARNKDEARFLRNWQDHPEGQRIFETIFQ